MLILKATERNWGLIGPGDWEKKSWKIEDSGWYQYTTSFRSGTADLPEIPAVTEAGQLNGAQFQELLGYMNSEWSEETTSACDGTAWEFKMYDGSTVVRHRDLGYIYGIEPYESMARVLSEVGE